jgi:hypothetical protein
MTNPFAASKDVLPSVQGFAQILSREDHLLIHVVPIPMGQPPFEDTHE